MLSCSLSSKINLLLWYHTTNQRPGMTHMHVTKREPYVLVILRHLQASMHALTSFVASNVFISNAMLAGATVTLNSWPKYLENVTSSSPLEILGINSLFGAKVAQSHRSPAERWQRRFSGSSTDRCPPSHLGFGFYRVRRTACSFPDLASQVRGREGWKREMGGRTDCNAWNCHFSWAIADLCK